MRITLGVDSRTPEANEPILSLLQRLAFPNSHVDVVHIVAPLVLPSGEMLPALSGFAMLSYEQMEWPDASAAVTAVAEKLQGHYTTTEVVVNGAPAIGLLHEAERSKTDLIALNASHDPAWKSAFIGSVARAAVIGSTSSVLLARPRKDSSRPLHAVLATDHSPYVGHCIERLGTFLPQGIAELTVLTAFPLAVLQQQLVAAGKFDQVTGNTMEHELMGRNADVIARLDAAFGDHAPVMQSRVVDAPIHEAICQTMEETNADLLILGAHGHSFIERLTTGSISFREALSSPYSVLILRA